jgi:hypothetical protein
MFKRLFFSSDNDGKPVGASGGAGGPIQGAAAAEPSDETLTRALPETSSRTTLNGAAIGVCANFDDIYRNDPARPEERAYNILKVADMIKSTHLSGMSPEAKQASVLMALEAAGVDVDALLQDATLRQRALNDYEAQQRARLRELEAAKARESDAVRLELERITAEHQCRIQALADDLTRQQENFATWQKRKQQEIQRIVEASALCTRQSNAPASNNLTALLERAAAARS